MKLKAIQARMVADHMSDYVDRLKDDFEYGGYDRGDLERMASCLSEAIQLRDAFNEYLLSRP